MLNKLRHRVRVVGSGQLLDEEALRLETCASKQGGLAGGRHLLKARMQKPKPIGQNKAARNNGNTASAGRRVSTGLQSAWKKLEHDGSVGGHSRSSAMVMSQLDVAAASDTMAPLPCRESVSMGR